MPLSRAQRAVLVSMLIIDGLLCVFPPFVRHGHQWLFAYSDYGDPPNISLGQLAVEIFIVAVIGATAVALARSIPDGRIEAALQRVKQWCKVLLRLKATMAAAAAILVLTLLVLTLGAIAWATGQQATSQTRYTPAGNSHQYSAPVCAPTAIDHGTTGLLNQFDDKTCYYRGRDNVVWSVPAGHQ